MVQRLAVSPGTLGRIVEVGLSLGDIITFIENSSGQSQMMQTRSDSQSCSSWAGFGIMTLVGAKKVALMWGIDIPWSIHFLFFPLEA